MAIPSHPLPPPKILIRMPNWLGDLMMATAFVQALLSRFPLATVDLIVPAGFESLPWPHRGQVLTFRKKSQSAGAFGQSLRSAGYTHFYLLPPSFSSAWMAFRAGVPQRIGYAGGGRAWLLSPARRYRVKHRSQHLVQEYLDLLEEPPTLQEFSPKLAITPEWIATHLSRLATQLPERYLAVAPGAIYGPAKEWPIGSYQELVGRLARQGWPVLILGTPADQAAGAQIQQNLAQVHNWCGQTSLAELVALLARAELLISNDSGTMHIMTALQRPQVAIFGSTSPTWTGPLNPRAQVVTHALECSPCFARTCRFGHYACLRGIPPVEVEAVVLKLLNPQ